MNRIDNAQLRAFLEDTEKIPQATLEELFHEAKKSNSYLGKLLLEKKLITDEKLRELEAYILGIPFIDLTKERIDQTTLHLIPEPIAQKYSIVAYKKTGGGFRLRCSTRTI